MPRVDLEFPTPIMNAAGFLSFEPPARTRLKVELGTFVTHPISLKPRQPAVTRTVVPFPGGYLLHSGLPNPGLNGALRKFAPRWAAATCPVWVHLIPSTPYEAAIMVREVERLENISAVEIGLEIGDDPSTALDILLAAAGELPLVASVPLHTAGSWLGQVSALGISAITLTAPRGAWAGPSGLTMGRLYGPSLYPQTLAAVSRLCKLGLPVIAGTGVWSHTAVRDLLSAGASAVQLDGVLWNLNRW